MPRNPVRPILLIPLFVAASVLGPATAPARAQSPTQRVVEVRNYWGGPVAGVTVELRNGGVAEASGITNAAGLFAFNAFSGATYTIGSAPFPNYGVAESAPFTVTPGSAGPTVRLVLPPP